MLVSAMYRQTRTTDYTTPDEAQRRLRATLRRLIAVYGAEEVLRRIRAYPVVAGDRGLQVELVLMAEAEINRQVGGTG